MADARVEVRDPGLDTLIFLNKVVTAVKKDLAECDESECSTTALVDLEPQFVRLLDRYYNAGYRDGQAGK